jgi:hypothetical protein
LPAPADDPLYVGYEPVAPPPVARRARRAVIALFALIGTVALVLVMGQRRLDGRIFEFGAPREFHGVLELDPEPTLLVTRPGARAGVSRWLLVGAGKHGARELLTGLDGAGVRLRGELISRGSETMLQVEPGSVEREALPAATPEVASLGLQTLRGEIVDSKCHLGVMNPGEGKSHRDCAVRCISGGSPALLRTLDAAGESRVYRLLGPDGRALGPELLDFVAEPVEMRGSVERRDGVYVLRTDPAAIRRLSGAGGTR